MEEFLGYTDDSVFADLSGISDKESDLLEELSSSGSYGSASGGYEYSVQNEPLYGSNNDGLLDNVLNSAEASLSSNPQSSGFTGYAQTENSSVDAPSSIGCGCPSCCGDSSVGGYDNSTYVDSNGNIVADAQVGGSTGYNALTSGYSWPTDGESLTLTYNFVTSLPGYYSSVDAEYRTGFQAMNANQAAASSEVLSVIENYINIDFVQVGSSASADMSFMQVARSSQNVVAHAWYPTGSQVGGDVFLNTAFWGYDTDPNYGDLVYQTLFHEVGHALGLKHSFDADQGSGDTLTASEENNTYSVMSYTRVGGNAGSMMMHDIAELQRLYGVNDTYNTGNDTYNIVSGTHFTIWDAGGNDTLSGAGQSADLTIRLEDGTLSEIGTTRIGIAFNAEIENATGGSGDDTIYGNELNNTILGGNGNDTIYGSLGDDNINGQGGTDTISYTYDANAFGFNFINGTTVAINHLVQGFTDTLSNFETFLFNGVSYTFATLQSTFANETPVLTANNVNLVNGNYVLASSAISATDADGDALTYTVRDGDAGANSGYFELDGSALAAGQDHSLTAAEFSRLRIVGGGENGTETLSVRVSDGQVTTDWSDITLTSTITGNQAPTVTVNNLTLTDGGNALASSVITANDSNGDTLTYKVWDTTTSNTSGYFELGGSALAAGVSHVLTEAEFAQLRIVGGSSAGIDQLWVQVDDGTHHTAWTSLTLTSNVAGGGGDGNTTTNDSAPTVSVSNVTLSDAASVLASTLISASDADGNPLTYFVWDAGKGSTSGHFELEDNALNAGRSHTLTQEQFDALNVVGGDDEGTDTLWVRVSDGENLTAWTSFTLNSTVSGGGGSGGGNASSNDAAPTVTANNLTLAGGVSASASSTISANDADGNPLTYFVWDDGRGANSGYFELDGSALNSGRSYTLTQAEFDNLNIVGGSDAATETLWVRVSDGQNLTSWVSFSLTSSGGGGGGGGGGGSVNANAPTVSATNLSLDQAETTLASSVITADDADGNTLTYYVWDDGRDANSGYFDLDGSALNAGRSHVLTQAQFDRLDIVGGNNADTETLWIRVSDGTNKTSWTSFTLTSTGNAPGGMIVEGDVLDQDSDEQALLDTLSAGDQSVLGSDSGDVYAGLSETTTDDLYGDQSQVDIL